MDSFRYADNKDLRLVLELLFYHCLMQSNINRALQTARPIYYSTLVCEIAENIIQNGKKRVNTQVKKG